MSAAIEPLPTQRYGPAAVLIGLAADPVASTLTNRQLLFLAVVCEAEAGGVQPTEMETMLEMSLPSVGRMAAILMQRGLIERRAGINPHDLRQAFYLPTADGLAAHARIHQLFRLAGSP